MKKIILICVTMMVPLFSYAQKFTGTLNYKTSPDSSWEGINATINVSITSSTSSGGISYDFVVNNVKVNSIKIRQREIAAQLIPAGVLSKLENDIRIGSLDFNLYVHDFNLKRMETKSTIGWAELQRLDNSEGYKQSVRDAGYELYNSGSLYIKNVKINTLSYYIDDDYRTKIENEIAGKTKKNENENAQNNNSAPLTLKVTSSSDNNTTSSESSASGSESANSASSSSSSSESSSSESEATVYNNVFLAEAARKQQEEKAYQDVVKGVFDLFTPSAEESERRGREYVRKMEYKAELDKSLVDKIKQAENGDDQAYFDIYNAYQYSFPADARYYRRQAYSTGNASLFKADRKLERRSPKAMFIGYQYGEISPYGLSFFQTTDNFGFFMLFRLSEKAFTLYSEYKDISNNRDVYTTGNGTTYTYLSEATKQEQGKFMLSLGTSYHVYKPLFIYAGVGFALVNTFSNQQKLEYNKTEILQIDESYYGASTDVGLMIKLGRRIAINGGVSFVNFKNPEYTGGLSFNFFPEK